MSLAEIPMHTPATLLRISGPRALRRRLLEMGLVPGTLVEVVSVSPLGDPLQLSVRGARLSIRKKDARSLEVQL